MNRSGTLAITIAALSVLGVAFAAVAAPYTPKSSQCYGACTATGRCSVSGLHTSSAQCPRNGLMPIAPNGGGRGAMIYSITSSARASSVDGTSMPSALAVLRLIAISYLVGACTARFAGFSPLRMRSI